MEEDGLAVIAEELRQQEQQTAVGIYTVWDEKACQFGTEHQKCLEEVY